LASGDSSSKQSRVQKKSFGDERSSEGPEVYLII